MFYPFSNAMRDFDQAKIRRVGLIGGSMAAYNTSTSTGVIDQENRGIVTWANMLLGCPLTVVKNGAVAGRTTAQTLANIQSDIMTEDIGMCFVFNGGNDIISGVPLATIQANLDAIYRTLLGGGIVPVAITVTPGGATAAQVNAQIRLNQWIRDWAAKNGGLRVYDAYADAVNPTAGTDSWRTGYSYDGTHPMALGGYALGYGLATMLQREFGISNGVPSVASLMDTWTNANATAGAGINLYDGGAALMQGTSGTTNNLSLGTPASISGSVPGNSATDRINMFAESLNIAGMIVTNSIAADGNGYGNYHQMAVTITSAGQYVADVVQSVHGRGVDQKWYAAEFVVDVIAGTVRPSEIAAILSFNAGQTKRSSIGWEVQAATAGISADVTQMRLVTPRQQFVTADTSLQGIIRFKFRTTGTCTLRVRRAALRQYDTQFGD